VRAYCEANLTGYKRPKIVEFRTELPKTTGGQDPAPRTGDGQRAAGQPGVVQAGRERELANLYRGNDDARRLSDEEFAEVLAFTKTAFDMAVRFRFAGSARARPAAKGRGE
jgi:hypothetical protein